MWNRYVVFAVALTVFCAPALAYAQCSHLTGSPAPTFEQFAANRVLLKYGSTGPGSSDDKLKLKKSVFNASSFSFDPLVTHSVHIAYRVNTANGMDMWTTDIPPSSTMWTVNSTGTKWTFNDPTMSNNGVRKLKIKDFGGGVFVVKKMIARNTNIMSAPFGASDNVYVMVEIEMSGSGICYGGASTSCLTNPSGTRQKCFS